MSFRLNIEELKTEYIGKTINWLTIIDIFRDENTNLVMFKCQCRCGNIKSYPKKIMTSKHAKISCGCYKSSPEKSAHIKQYNKDHPELKVKISEKMKQMYKDHPEKAKQISDRNKKLYINDPLRRQCVGKRISDWFKNNPDKVNEWADKRRSYYKEHPEIGEARSQLYKDNPDIIKKISDGNKKFNIENPSKIKHVNELNSEISLEKRKNSNYDKLVSVIKPSYLENLLKGFIKAGDIIETKCPVCGKYAPHIINSVYNLSRADFRLGKPPLCKDCHINLTSHLTSQYEQEIADYILTFYSGECIRNDRTILNGKELDLYYPEKKIAIEFNGDYWHSTLYKPKDYHYNKFKQCLDNNILLVSVFELDWINNKEAIKKYIIDTFNGVTNSLSLVNEIYMNNNYPSLEYVYSLDYSDVLEHSYTSHDYTTFTCGYSKIKLNVINQ